MATNIPQPWSPVALHNVPPSCRYKKQGPTVGIRLLSPQGDPRPYPWPVSLLGIHLVTTHSDQNRKLLPLDSKFYQLITHGELAVRHLDNLFLKGIILWGVPLWTLPSAVRGPLHAPCPVRDGWHGGVNCEGILRPPVSQERRWGSAQACWRLSRVTVWWKWLGLSYRPTSQF